ncbi:lipopolysaccharide biosynthesis protein [Enterococcus saccharolyticus]|uniref:lipopolysaccharide biosynthesis protein n=1 Tax=Enterococcus saccharolyticus TaxID=41997 RepID=UPI0039E04AF0
MNEKTKNFIKNLNYTVSANFLILGISVILNLVVPKFLGVTGYSYWQLYVFYSSYVGFFHLGWIDGIYLKLGGKEYEDLDKKNLSTQLYYLFLFELILALLLIMYTIFFIVDPYRQIIWFATAFMLIVSNIKNFILYILQATNRIKEYAKLSRNDRYLYLIGSVGYLILGGRNPIFLITMDVFTKFIVTVLGLIQIQDIITSNRIKFKNILVDIKENIKIGSNLMFGNIASMLILGVSRFFVEKKWSIETFGKLSFALSISNMFMLFINSISIVLYPLLRRTNQSNLSNLYIQVRNLFVPFTLLVLLFFNPLRMLLEWWLPAYKESLFFMGILFPMIVYEGRVSLLINTYLKTIREEKVILISNIITLAISFVMASVSVYIFKSVNLTVATIITSLAIRCLIAESMLTKILRINVTKENIFEGILIFIFIMSNIFLTNFESFFVYFIVFVCYLLFSISKIKNGLTFFYYMIKK